MLNMLLAAGVFTIIVIGLLIAASWAIDRDLERDAAKTKLRHLIKRAKELKL